MLAAADRRLLKLTNTSDSSSAQQPDTITVQSVVLTTLRHRNKIRGLHNYTSKIRLIRCLHSFDFTYDIFMDQNHF